MAHTPTTAFQLFYSYCHKDASHRMSMETSLQGLRQEGILDQWSDQEILPGQMISAEIRAKMEEADIIVFIFTPDFIASEECMHEWGYAQTLAGKGRKPLFRIPIIARPCAWKDVLKDDDVKTLPNDGQPVTHYSNVDDAWLEVYEGIKTVLCRLRTTFMPRQDFLTGLDKSDFIAQDYLKLRDLFTFLRLSPIDLKALNPSRQSSSIDTQEQLLSEKRALIHGEEKTGKTSLARHLYLSLVEQAEPVLYLEPSSEDRILNDQRLRRIYQNQFHGDYTLWSRQPHKTLIIDGLSKDSIDLIGFADKIFERIILTVSSDVFYAYFMDDTRLAEFQQLKIEQLTLRQQERLIRKRLELSNMSEPVSDGLVDRAEDHVNSVIISGRIVPRYPFFVLSILQTYEGYMPTNLSITSYGHCYYVLIFASLVRAGVSQSDDSINTCFNLPNIFHLAFTYMNNPTTTTSSALTNSLQTTMSASL